MDKNPLNRVSRGNIEIATSPQFLLLSGLIASVKHSIMDDAMCNTIPTACTNGIKVMWNPQMISDLSQKELNFVIVHEVAHIILQHITMWKHLWTENKNRANAAADFVVNAFIKEQDPNESVCKMPSGKYAGLYDPKYTKMTTKQVWDALVKDYPEMCDQTPESGFDVHDFNDLTPEEKKQIEVAINVGKNRVAAAGRSVDLDEIEEIDWRDLISQWVMRIRGNGDKSSWDRPNRRHIGRGIYFPSRMSESVREAVIAIDESGSISKENMGEFLSHLKSLCEAVRITKLHILYWDIGVNNHEVHDMATGEKVIEETRPAGGGGTNFAPVLDYMKDIDLVPMFMVGMTDGYIQSWGEMPEFPSIWLINNNEVTAPYGDTLRIN